LLRIAILLFPLLLPFLNACTGDNPDAGKMGVDFQWQQKDQGSTDNPEIRLTGVPPGTTQFFVKLVDLDLPGFDHGGGFAANDGSGVIARGAARGNYNGPDPPWPKLGHTYEITVKAYDAQKNLLGIGKKALAFPF